MHSLSYRQLPADLGLEPPITTEGIVVQTVQRHRVNGRWLAGTILIALSGSALMVLAVFGALKPLDEVVSTAQLVKARDERSGAVSTIVARKSDKLIRRANLVAARQDYRVPVLVKVGESEITKQASYTRLATPLATDSLGFAEQVPAFNLAKLVSLASEDRAAIESDFGGTQDTEVQLSFRDIRSIGPIPDSGTALRDEDAFTQVMDMLNERRRETPRAQAQSQLAKVMRTPQESSAVSSFASGGVGDPFSKLVVKMVPENVTVLPRQESILLPMAVEERIVLSKNQASTTQSLKAAGATPRQINEIVAALTRSGKATTLEGNRLLKLTMQPAEPGGAKELMRVELYFDEQLIASTGRRDDGVFWPIEMRDPPAAPKPADADAEEDEEAEANSGRLTLYASIHETARRHDIAPPVIDEIIRTIFFDVDLQRRISPGDQLEILIANGEGDNARQELQLVSLTTSGNRRRYYRFKLPNEDVVDFFDDQGRSVKQFLLRKPIDGGEFRSGFGMRRHPILRSYRLHSGVDWAGPAGLPIRAAGNGIVRLAEWSGGYGRRVEIEHNHGYMTAYNHMSAFGPGIEAGVRVRQGQIIGRLGSSGLSTGSHLHYEVSINDRMVDPLAIRLPRGRELGGNALADFRKERDIMENVIKRAPGSAALIAQN